MPFVNSVRGSFGTQGRFGFGSGLLSSSSGGTITTSGSYRIHTFLIGQTGTNFTSSGAGTVEYLIVAGAGGGGWGASSYDGNGGGGAGGYLSGTTNISGTSYAVTVGNSGTAGTKKNFW